MTNKFVPSDYDIQDDYTIVDILDSSEDSPLGIAALGETDIQDRKVKILKQYKDGKMTTDEALYAITDMPDMPDNSPNNDDDDIWEMYGIQDRNHNYDI